MVAGVAIGLAAIAIGAAVTNQTADWARLALLVGGCLVLLAIYSVLAAYLALPFPSPRSEPIWRGAWWALPFSKHSRIRRAEVKRRAVKERLLNLLAGEAMRSGLSAQRAAQSLLEATVSPGPRNYWVALAGGGHYMLGFEASGNIVEVAGPGLDNPEVEARIDQFEAIVAAAQSWPELVELKRLEG